MRSRNVDASDLWRSRSSSSRGVDNDGRLGMSATSLAHSSGRSYRIITVFLLRCDVFETVVNDDYKGGHESMWLLRNIGLVLGVP